MENKPGVKKKLEKVIDGKARVRKQSELSKVGNLFSKEDMNNIWSSILNNIVIPAAKKMLSESIKTGTDMFIWRGDDRSRASSPVPYVSYNQQYNSISTGDRFAAQRSTPVRAGFRYEEIIVPSRSDAERVLDQLTEQLVQYGMVSVADLYESVGITGHYTDNRYGWFDIGTAEPVPVRDGWLIKMPKPVSFN